MGEGGETKGKHGRQDQEALGLGVGWERWSRWACRLGGVGVEC